MTAELLTGAGVEDTPIGPVPILRNEGINPNQIGFGMIYRGATTNYNERITTMVDHD